MADEATIYSSMRIVKGHLEYNSLPSSFSADVSTAKAPTPGQVAVTVSGTTIDLSALTTPGLCRIQNLDADYWVEYGIWDPESGLFYPLGELLAGESYVIRLARYIHDERGTGTGTGTAGPATNVLQLRSHGGTANVLVEAFEK